MEFKKELNGDAYRFLLTGGLSLSDKLPDHPSIKFDNADWLSAKSWGEICRLTDVPGFEDFYKAFYQEATFNRFKEIYDSLDPHE